DQLNRFRPYADRSPCASRVHNPLNRDSRCPAPESHALSKNDERDTRDSKRSTSLYARSVNIPRHAQRSPPAHPFDNEQVYRNALEIWSRPVLESPQSAYPAKDNYQTRVLAKLSALRQPPS